MNHSTIRRSILAMAVFAACGAATADPLPPFTFDPSAAGLDGSAVHADNILVSDYSTVHTSGSTFSETGYLAVSGFQLGGVTLSTPSLNADYSLFFKFTGNGTLTQSGNPVTTPTAGSFTALTFTLYGSNSPTTFGFDPNNTPTSSAVNPMALATGSLLYGAVGTLPSGNNKTFVPSADATLNFNVLNAAFFESPVPFYELAETAFTNTTSEVQSFDGGFRIRQGGGTVNFTVAAVPEPGTYGLMLAGLGAMAFVAKRRRR
ncbi:MAG: flocculation-associated PEP-CTERM protein PepA [Pseudomonadota bacterium]|nr:flocculation-associated PEP-CTERM protein PepA [Pseudomonadota bacterium]